LSSAGEGEESLQPRQVPAVSIYDGEGVVEMRMIVDYRIVQKRGDQVGQHLSVTGGQVGQAPPPVPAHKRQNEGRCLVV
jgi:hypothetical protein